MPLKTERMNLTRFFFNVLLRTNAFLLMPGGVVSMQKKGWEKSFFLGRLVSATACALLGSSSVCITVRASRRPFPLW